MTVKDLARRIDTLEKTVAELSGKVRRTGVWYVENAGEFKGDPVYEEIDRRGRAYRRSLRPKTASRRKS